MMMATVMSTAPSSSLRITSFGVYMAKAPLIHTGQPGPADGFLFIIYEPAAKIQRRGLKGLPKAGKITKETKMGHKRSAKGEKNR